LPLRYFFFSISCHRPSSFINLNSHLLRRHLFWTSKSIMPRPPTLFGFRKILHIANLYFFLCSSHCEKNRIYNSQVSPKHL
jgi:hypothetical protein